MDNSSLLKMSVALLERGQRHSCRSVTIGICSSDGTGTLRKQLSRKPGDVHHVYLNLFLNIAGLGFGDGRKVTLWAKEDLFAVEPWQGFSNPNSFASELREVWSETVDACIGLTQLRIMRRQIGERWPICR
jgi:hypothetical protein